MAKHTCSASLHPMLFPLYQGDVRQSLDADMVDVRREQKRIWAYATRIRQEGAIEEANLLGTVMLMLGVAQDHLEMALENFNLAQQEAEKRAT